MLLRCVQRVRKLIFIYKSISFGTDDIFLFCLFFLSTFTQDSLWSGSSHLSDCLCNQPPVKYSPLKLFAFWTARPSLKHQTSKGKMFKKANRSIAIAHLCTFLPLILLVILTFKYFANHIWSLCPVIQPFSYETKFHF